MYIYIYIPLKEVQVDQTACPIRIGSGILNEWIFLKTSHFVWSAGLPGDTPRKTNMTMEKQQFEDVSPVKIGDCPLTC